MSYRSMLLLGVFFCSAAGAETTAPWINAPAQEPAQQTAMVTAQRACADADLQIVVGRQGARKGFATQEIRVTNQGADACFLAGAPGITLLPPNAAPRTLAIHQNALANVQEQTTLAAGDTAVLLIGAPGACEAATGPQRNVTTRLQIVAPGGGKRIVGGAHVDTLCGDAAVLHLHVEHKESAPASPLEQLNGSVQLGSAPAAGGTMRYTVTLTNPTGAAITLSPCPAYTQSLYANGVAASSTWLLNCGASGNQIAAGSSVTYEMQLAVPAQLQAGDAKLSWQLHKGPAVGSLTSLR
jgi:hypothetical protein